MPEPDVATPGIVPHLSSTPGAVHRPGPEPGEHTATVLGKLLGLTDERIADLHQAGTIATGPRAG
ncbi:hypothetical protein [Blastococcus xanthinilyticus]|uniref:hypothetical protein n=1 Tax=Blastococcus xanthinilyticus TaxID=1564164 RepID=UPI001FB5C9D2|nr:hypothetical protein [Blastococcus xanthinilyticus]